MNDSFHQRIFDCTQSNTFSNQNPWPRGYDQCSIQDDWVPQMYLDEPAGQQTQDQYAELYSDSEWIPRNKDHQVDGFATIERPVKLYEQASIQRKKIKKNSACPVINIPDEVLRTAPIKELCAKLKDMEVIKAVKTKRRTLKNVVYARISRNKKAKVLQDAVEQCEMLTKQLNEAKETIYHLKNQLEVFRQKSRETTNLYVHPSPLVIEETTFKSEMANFGDQFFTPCLYENPSQAPSVMCNFEYGETDSCQSGTVSSSTSNDYWI